MTNDDGDPFDLARFVRAQDPLIEGVLDELHAGRKRTHWMWFVFPQLRGLGASSMARHYGIGSLDEARAYLAHAVLGPRLIACTRAVLAVERRTLDDVFGSPDDVKFRSCMTLFAAASEGSGSVFDAALERFCDGRRDERTTELLDASP